MRFAGMALDGGNYANAAMNSSANMDSILAKNTPDFGGLSSKASAARSQERVAGMEAEALLQNAGINGLAAMEQSKFGAQAIEAQGAAQASATRSQGMSNMIGSIAGGAISGIGKSSGIGGDWKDASSIGFKGNQVNNLGRLKY